MMNNYLAEDQPPARSIPTKPAGTLKGSLDHVTNATSAFEDQVQFLIKRGTLDQESGAFVQFKRQNVTRWGTIS